MADSATQGRVAPAVPAAGDHPRHAALVRVTHWLTTLAFFALLVTGVEILISHPRFYWGETGNVSTTPLFSFPIPASRTIVPTGYGYVLPDQNGWSRKLHFEAAWVLVFTGILYFAYGILRGHFWRNLLPSASEVSPKALAADLRRHLRRKQPPQEDAWSYNTLQRLSYLTVIFVLFPMIVWTGLAMSPGVVSAIPFIVTFWGGQQTARTLHFFLTVLLVVFMVVHVLMVMQAGFRSRVGAMITGRAGRGRE